MQRKMESKWVVERTSLPVFSMVPFQNFLTRSSGFSSVRSKTMAVECEAGAGMASSGEDQITGYTACALGSGAASRTL